jgi:hypothetical protein
VRVPATDRIPEGHLHWVWAYSTNFSVLTLTDGEKSRDLANHFKLNFEDALKIISSHALPPLQRAMAAYFFEFRPQPSNLYIELAQRIQRSRWSGTMCSLNYDRMLELSLLQTGIQPFVGDPPPRGGGVELCHPHGCCHIFCDSVRGAASGVSFDAFGVQTNGPISVVGDPKQHRTRILQDAFPPVMSYFEPAKRTSTGRSFIEGQRERWRQLVSTAAALVIIGVRVHPTDAHIWGPIAASPSRIVYCGGSSGAPEYAAWATTNRNGRTDLILNGFFRDEFDRICFEVGI